MKLDTWHWRFCSCHSEAELEAHQEQTYCMQTNSGFNDHEKHTDVPHFLILLVRTRRSTPTTERPECFAALSRGENG